jgi:asparagine synthase (glutamine-hydrolysing)
MRGLMGWQGNAPEESFATMWRGAGRPQPAGLERQSTAAATLAAWGGSLHREAGLSCAIAGRPFFDDAELQALPPAVALARLWRQHGEAAPAQIQGSFSLALIDHDQDCVFLALDRIGDHALAFAAHPGGCVFASRADLVAAHPAVGRSLDPQGLFNYLYFHDVPAPGSVYRGVEKLLPGQWARCRGGAGGGQITRGFYWALHYRDQPRHDFEEQKARFLELIRAGVKRAKGDDEVATFLSGGTDSSTVSGMLKKVAGQARTYSIGFSAEGFDEMEYARLAGRHFGLDMHEYYLQPADIMEAIPVIANYYDEPFGNDSAVPAYFCAKLAAADGHKIMLAGDGGDEFFGGNARYAKQRVFEAYHALPGFLRAGLIEPLANLPGMAALGPGRKLQSYLRQANTPLPERMEAYNFIYRQPLQEMFASEFLAGVDAHQPGTWLKEVYDRTDSQSYINRMLHLDIKFTLADSDLRKVGGMTEAAGIEVRYPLMDDAIVDFSGEIPPDWKVKGQYLRWFFKTALKGFLPDEIIDKTKHGFGLPFGVWARDYAPLRERIEDRLADFRKRGLLTPAYVDHVRSEHMSGHATYFGKMVWVMLSLEEWLAARGL